MQQIKIIIAEHDNQAYEGLKESYENIFSYLGYKSSFILYVDLEKEDDYLEYDILIMDISWGNVEGYDGLEFISKIKKRFPNLFIIANSQERIDHYTSSKYLPSFDIFVQKDFLVNKDYQLHIIEKIKSRFKKNIYLKLDKASDIGKYNKETLTDLLKDITFIDHDMDPEFTVSKVKLSPLYGGWSDSQVFKMEMYSSKNLELTNAILKVSTDSELIEREVRNYLKFVKLYIPYMGRPEMIGYSYSKNLGAVCYSFAYDDDVDFKSLSEHINEGNYKKLQKAIDIIFRPNKSRWYNKRNWKESREGLTVYYKEKWIPDEKQEGSENCFKKIIQNNSGRMDKNKIQIFNNSYTHPSTILFGKPIGKFTQTISHGDLNINNILLSSDDFLTYIDFSETKHGHVFEDFVTFEGSLRSESNFNLSLAELVNIEEFYSHKNLPSSNQIKQYSEAIIQKYEAIHRLRDHAFSLMKTENKRNYYYALAFYLYRLLRIDDYDNFQYNQITAGLLLSLKKLD